ncbi:MAG TPA: protease pro-enzyme activation domain-containing protein [Terracidiphilus sp.]
MKTVARISRQTFLWMCGLSAVCTILVPSAGAQLQPGAGAPKQPTARISGEFNSNEQATLRNSLHPMAEKQFDAGRMPSDTKLGGITMIFTRSAEQETAVRTLMAEQQNPASPLYHQWLTPDQFAARFGMSDADLTKVKNWLEQQGFSIDQVARSKNAIHFSGSVRQVEQAFSTEMHYYKVQGTQHFAPSTELSVPTAIADTVLVVQNLDDFHPHSHAVYRKNARVKPSFTAAGSTNATNEQIFFAPGDIYTAYNIQPLISASVTGAGQSITLVGQSAIQTSDIENFQNAAGLAVKDPQQYLVPNSGNSAVSAGDESESDIDLEWSGAMAPGATINFVFVGNSGNYSAFDSILYAIDENIGTIISSSYGECEAALPLSTLASGTNLQTGLEAAFEQAATQGQTVMAAAGDDGSTDCSGENISTAQDEALAVDYPASSANVTAMGGTEINQTNASYETVGLGYWQSDPGTTNIVTSVLQYIPEQVWNDDAESIADGGTSLSAGGGGASALFPKPSYQTGVPGIPMDGKRDVPDLALYASAFNPGYLFCSSDTTAFEQGQETSCTSGFQDSATGDFTAAGGTSFNGPIFSGILALINQKQNYTAGQGLINPTLYTLASNSTTYASAFHDVTVGNNDCLGGSEFCSGTPGFSAGVGYDQATGLGSIDAANLVAAWPANSSTAPVLLPTTTTITAANSAPNVNVSDSFTITVASTSGTPTGTVNLTVDGGTAMAETLSSNGTFVYMTSFATLGSHTILAEYPSNSMFAGSSSSVTVNVSAVSSGTGTIALASSPSTLTVGQGKTGGANETLTVTPAGGYTGTVDLTVNTSNNTALQNLCIFFTNVNSAGDGTVVVSGTSAATTAMTLDADAADCATQAAMRATGKRPLKMLQGTATTSSKNTGSGPVPLTVAMAGLLLVGFMGRGSRRLRGLAGLLILATVGLAVTACGGVTTTPFSNPPTGTYTITVTGQDSVTSSIATKPTSFTLVIN